MLFHNCGTAFVTPFKNDGSVDYNAYRRLVERQIEGGVDFLVPLGTTAETPTLSVEERKKLLRITLECSQGKPILAGCGSNSPAATLANMEVVADADAFLVVTPFYNKPTQEGLYQYYKYLAERSSKPIVMYNVPGRTGVNMSAETTLRIAREIPGIIGVKEASGKFEQIDTIIKNAPEGFTVLSGDDDMTYELMLAGAHGVISVASNILPKEISYMTRCISEGRYAEADELNKKLFPLFKGCFIESNPIPTKEAMHQLGLCTNVMRLPLSTANANTAKTINNILKEWKLL